MNVRIASAITIRSGVITSRIETASRSRRISFIAIRFSTSRWTSPNTRSSGSETSKNVRASGRAAASSWRSRPNTLSSHHCATSGNESSRSVSPVGAQSTITTSQSPSSTWRLSCSRLKSSSPPGGTVSSSAAMRSTPWSTNSEPSHPCTADQLRSSSSWACTCWAHRWSETCVGSEPTGVSSDSASECAGSVDSTIVRWPAAAQRRAVAAATEVLPDPALARVEDGPRPQRAALALGLQDLDRTLGRADVARQVDRGHRHVVVAGPARDRPAERSACRGRRRPRPASRRPCRRG